MIVECEKCGCKICVSKGDFATGHYPRMCPKCLRKFVPVVKTDELKPHKVPRKKNFDVEQTVTVHSATPETWAKVISEKDKKEEDGVDGNMPSL